jgi:hypothetical protein
VKPTEINNLGLDSARNEVVRELGWSQVSVEEYS